MFAKRIIPEIAQSEASSIRSTLLLLAPILLLQALLICLIPLPLKEAINHIKDFNLVLQMAAIGAGLAILVTALDFFEQKVHSTNVIKIHIALREGFIEKILSRSYIFFNRYKPVNLVTYLTSDVNNLEILFRERFVVILRGLPLLFLLMGGIFYINLYLGFLLALILPLYFLMARNLSKKIKEQERKALEGSQDLEDFSLQILNFIPTVKSLQAEGRILATIRETLIRHHEFITRLGKAAGNFSLSLNAVRVLSRPIILLIGAYSIYLGKMTIGDLFVVISYLEALQRPVFEISDYMARSPRAYASLKRLRVLSEAFASFNEQGGQLKAMPSSATTLVSLSNVQLNFQSQKQASLNNVNLTLERGALYGLIGPSGSGKSSLLKVINRFYSPDSGIILFEGEDIRKFDVHSLRKSIRIILQEDLILPFSLRENINLFASSPLSDEEIWALLEKVNAKRFVQALPQQLDTLLGDGGHPLSGGEKKRISLARAFTGLEEVKLIAFDEATSGLDPDSARVVMNSIRKISECGVTVIYATHRPEEIDQFQNMIKVNQGSIKQSERVC